MGLDPWRIVGLSEKKTGRDKNNVTIFLSAFVQTAQRYFNAPRCSFLLQ
jgi:hypothetical protein